MVNALLKGIIETIKPAKARCDILRMGFREVEVFDSEFEVDGTMEL